MWHMCGTVALLWLADRCRRGARATAQARQLTENRISESVDGKG